MTSLWQNVRYTIRALGKNPGFAIVSVLSLALAIGANTAIFSLLDALLLRDLPVHHPERLVELSVVRRGDKIMFSYPMFREIESSRRSHQPRVLAAPFRRSTGRGRQGNCYRGAALYHHRCDREVVYWHVDGRRAGCNHSDEGQ